MNNIVLEGEALFNFLKQQYSGGSISKQTNGGYLVSCYGGPNGYDKIYFPPQIREQQDFIVYNGGTSAGDVFFRGGAELRNEVTAGKYNNTIVAFGEGGASVNNTSLALNEVMQNAGVTISNDYIHITHSGTGGGGLLSYNEYVKNNPNTKGAYIAADGWGFIPSNEYKTANYNDALGAKNNLGRENTTALREAQIPILLIGPDESTKGVIEPAYVNHAYDSANYLAKDLDLNVYFITSNPGSHAGINQRAIYEVLPYIKGNTNSMGAGFSCQKYNKDLDQWIQLTEQEVADAVQNGIIPTSVRLAPTSKEITPSPTSTDDQEISTSELGNNEFLETTTTNNEYTPLTINNMKKNSNNYITSDLNYICTTMNNIRSSIKKSQRTTKVGEYELKSTDTTGIPGCIGGYINSYLSMVDNLYDKTYDQAEAIVSYGQYIVDMDNDLSTRTNTLNNDLTTPDNKITTPTTSSPGTIPTENLYEKMLEPNYIFKLGNKTLYISTDTKTIKSIKIEISVDDNNKIDSIFEETQKTYGSLIQKISKETDRIIIDINCSTLIDLTIEEIKKKLLGVIE